MGEGDDTRARAVSERRRVLPSGTRSSAGKREERIPLRVITRDGPRLNLGLGRNGSPGPFSYFQIFLIFLFWILNCFITFAKMLQITSNKFLNSSNLLSNLLNQQEIYFQR
jgi:hypothetical protein